MDQERHGCGGKTGCDNRTGLGVVITVFLLLLNGGTLLLLVTLFNKTINWDSNVAQGRQKVKRGR